jgi:integrase
MTPLRQRMIETMVVRNYSERTIEAYVWWVALFARHFGRSPELLGPEEVHEFQVWLQGQYRTSWAGFNQAMCGLRLLYREVLGRPEMVERLHFMRRETKVPVVLSPDEVSALLAAVDPLESRTILTTIYACGLRLSEALHLRPGDIDSARGMVWVRRGKGRKDRGVALSPVLLEMLRSWWRTARPVTWLFPSRCDASRPCSDSTVQKAIHRAAKAAGIRKPVSPRTLRHSFATHAMESGTPLRVIQTVLGHRSMRTTEIYTHVTPEGLARLRSPLETLPPPSGKRG